MIADWIVASPTDFSPIDSGMDSDFDFDSGFEAVHIHGMAEVTDKAAFVHL